MVGQLARQVKLKEEKFIEYIIPRIKEGCQNAQENMSFGLAGKIAQQVNLKMCGKYFSWDVNYD